MDKTLFSQMLQSVSIPSDPHVRANIKSRLRDLSDQMTLLEARKDFIKESIEASSEEFDIPKKFMRKLAKAYHAQTFQQQQQEMEEFTSLYESIVGNE